MSDPKLMWGKKMSEAYTQVWEKNQNSDCVEYTALGWKEHELVLFPVHCASEGELF